VSHRPLVLVTGLTVGDYLLWNWSLNGNHDVLALISGLTLPPIAVACLWLMALTVARLAGRTRAHAGGRGGARGRASRYTDERMDSAQARMSDPAGTPLPAADAAALEDTPITARSARRRSRKLAA
jgi:hypothetical protein